jgi:hypothetical protein
MGDDKPTNVRITCDHQGCGATAPSDARGWQLTAFGERCPEHHIALQPVPPRPRKVLVHHEPPRTRDTVITPEQASSVLAALAEEGLTVDSDGYCVPLDPSHVDSWCTHSSDCFELGEVLVDSDFLCPGHARLAGVDVDDATLELELFEAPKCHHPLSREDVAALESIKAAVRRKLGET